MLNTLALTADKKKTVQFTCFIGTKVQILTPEEVRARHVMANMLALISDNKKTVRDAVLAWYLVYSVYLVLILLSLLSTRTTRRLRRSACLVLSLLASLVQKYKY